MWCCQTEEWGLACYARYVVYSDRDSDHPSWTCFVVRAAYPGLSSGNWGVSTRVLAKEQGFPPALVPMLSYMLQMLKQNCLGRCP